MHPGCLSNRPRAALPKTNSSGTARRKITIAWIPKGLNNPVFEVGRAGAIAKAAELTAAGPVDVEVLYAGSVDSDGSEQVRVIDDAVARGVNAIAISCDDPTACIDPINRAVNAGIPVMTWDADPLKASASPLWGLIISRPGMPVQVCWYRQWVPRGKWPY